MKTLSRVSREIQNAKFGTELLFVNIHWQKNIHDFTLMMWMKGKKGWGALASVGIFKPRIQMCLIQVHKLLSCFNDVASAAVFRRLTMI
jgi:hypothetical protein